MKDLTKPILLVTTHVKRNLATNIAEAFKNYNIRLVSKQADSQVGLHWDDKVTKFLQKTDSEDSKL